MPCILSGRGAPRPTEVRDPPRSDRSDANGAPMPTARPPQDAPWSLSTGCTCAARRRSPPASRSSPRRSASPASSGHPCWRRSSAQLAGRVRRSHVLDVLEAATPRVVSPHRPWTVWEHQSGCNRHQDGPMGADEGYLLANQQDQAGVRLAALATLFDPSTFRHLDALGVGPGWRCWEVGAGGRSVPDGLAARVGPTGAVLATDVDTARLAG